MDAHAIRHPTDKMLCSFGLGKLDGRSAQAVSKHLEECDGCRKRVAEMSADSFLGRIRDAQPRGRPLSDASQPHLMDGSKGLGGPSPRPANTLPPGLADHPDYEIKRELGRGGMGVVYLAHNKWMGRDEVLKVMGRQVMERPEVLERFQREIRAVAKLRHPNIVTAYHASQVGENIIFAMEYVPGLDLSRTLKATGPMPVANACYFAHQTALGLQHAHDEGLVHRDIKPGNLMLTHRKDKAMIKILDFGLAKLTREEAFNPQLTSEGQAMGTPDYIAPEQIIDAMAADIRSDIYSLGGTLYHLLAGRPPFQAKSIHGVYQAHISQDADLLNFVRPEVPAELAAVVAKMIAKDPDRRFQTPGDVSKALKVMFKPARVSVAITGTEVSLVEGLSIANELPGASTTPTRPAITMPRPPGSSVGQSPEHQQQADVQIALTEAPDPKIEPMIDGSASSLLDWSRRPHMIVARIEPGGRVVLATFGTIVLRLLVVISSAITFGTGGAALDEARLSSMGVVFTVVGIVVASLLGGPRIRSRDHFAVGFTGGVCGVMIAAVLHAVIRSIEPALGTLSSSVGAILMFWAGVGALVGLILAVVIPHHQDSTEVAR